jgi:hypothetical protein
MAKTDEEMRIYTVVDVMSGVAVGAHSFRHLKDARTCMKRLTGRRNLEQDDVQLFESTIDVSEERHSIAQKI